MAAQRVAIDVVCDDFPDKIKAITKIGTELPQKYFVAWFDLMRPELDASTYPTDPTGGFLYSNRASYLNHERPIRPLNLIDSVMANGVHGASAEPMLIEFTSRNRAA
jgi:hypothetical protein